MMALHLLLAVLALAVCSKSSSRIRDPIFFDDFNNLCADLYVPTKTLFEFAFDELLELQTELSSTRWLYFQVSLAADNLKKIYLDFNMTAKMTLSTSKESAIICMVSGYAKEAFLQKMALSRLPDAPLLKDEINQVINAPCIFTRSKSIFERLYDRDDFLRGLPVKRLGEKVLEMLKKNGGDLVVMVWQIRLDSSVCKRVYISVERFGSLRLVLSEIEKYINSRDVEKLFLCNNQNDSENEISVSSFDVETPIGALYLDHFDPEDGHLHLYFRTQ